MVPLNIGILWPDNPSEWPGGTIYAENLLKSLAIAKPGQRVTVVVPQGGPQPSMLEKVGALDVEVVSYTPVTRKMPAVSLGLAYLNRKLGRADRSLAATARRAGIDVLFGDLASQVSFPVPWIGWIPDFQYRCHPEYFDEAEAAWLAARHQDLCRRASIVLLSSKDALSNLRTYYPEAADKARVLPFVSIMGDDLFAPEPAEVARRFQVEEPFVVVPNQWWLHKNHETAIRAAGLLRDRGVDCRWILTGATNDPRRPEQASRLLQLISELGLRDIVVPLGFLSRVDQVQLMRKAACIVQPSLFEGWSTVVEDAKTLGQRLVVSDIPIHREQEPGSAIFFDPSSAQALADGVREMLDHPCPRQDEGRARELSDARAREVGEAFAAICNEATR